jgi:hypothetical protein
MLLEEETEHAFTLVVQVRDGVYCILVTYHELHYVCKLAIEGVLLIESNTFKELRTNYKY